MERKYWHTNGLVDEDQMHQDQSPSEIYRDASKRLANVGSPGDKARLLRRWPKLVDALSALNASFEGLTEREKAADLAEIEADLGMIAAGLNLG